MPAQKCVELVENKLIQHKMSLERDIVCITTDGASVMAKVGKSIPCYQQLCYAHGLQLGVLNVLYKTKPDAIQPTDNLSAITTLPAEEDEIAHATGRHAQNRDTVAGQSEPDIEQITDYELHMDVEEYDEVEFDGLTFADDDTLCLQVFPELDENFRELIQKVRKVVCLFEHSPTKNDDVLQHYVKAEHGTPLSLMLDCKTRWSSMFAMLERFLTLQGPIRKALIDLKSTIVLSELEFTQIENLVRALETVKLTVDALCRRDANLLTAEAALKFMVTKLRSQDTSVSRDLVAALFTRIRQRRTQLSGVLRYLHNAKAFAEISGEDEDDDLFAMPTMVQVRKIIKSLVERLDASKEMLQQEDEASMTESAGSTTVGDDSTGVKVTVSAVRPIVFMT
jgi:hypothetical protein